MGDQSEHRARGDQSNAFELPPELNDAVIRQFAQGLAGFARWRTAREMHAVLEQAARSDR